MYNNKDKHFHCDHCDKIIETGEKCWIKWNFPPSHLKTQTLPRKSFEWENVPIICSNCSNKDIKMSDY